MGKLIASYFITLAVFLTIDGVWLGFIAKNFYRKQLGSLMTQNVVWWAAIVFYLIFVVGLLYFVILPGVEKQSLLWLIGSAALFGLITYATYDLTNLATLKDWSLLVTIVDMIWGAVLATTVSVVSYYIIRFL